VIILCGFIPSDTVYKHGHSLHCEHKHIEDINILALGVAAASSVNSGWDSIVPRTLFPLKHNLFSSLRGINIPYLRRLKAVFVSVCVCVCVCVFVWPLTRPCANPTQLQSPLEGLSHRQQKKGGGRGGRGTEHSHFHAAVFRQRHRTPLWMCVSCAPAQSF